MIHDETRPSQEPAKISERAQIAMGLIYTMGFPIQLACWIMCGMKKQAYSKLKNSIEKSYGQTPGTIEDLRLAHAKRMDDVKVNRIIRQLKINGYWRDMPKSEYRDMLSSIGRNPGDA